MLTLPERLLLISIDNRGTTRDPKSSLGYALAGAVLSELLLDGRLRHDDGRVVATSSRTGDILLDEVLAEVGREERSRTLKWWVNRLSSRHGGRKPVRDRLIDLLTERGVLARGQRRVLGLVPVATHPVADPASAERARAAVGEVLLDRQDPDERSAALLALVQVSGLLDACVPDADRRQARRPGQADRRRERGGRGRQADPRRGDRRGHGGGDRLLGPLQRRNRRLRRINGLCQKAGERSGKLGVTSALAEVLVHELGGDRALPTADATRLIDR